MAINSTFYDGVVDEVSFSTAISRVGSTEYGVRDANDLKVSVVSGVDRTVSVGTGACWGKGVHDTMTTATTVALPASTSGSRWDLIAVHRVWSTNTTTIVRVQGTSSKAIPSSRAQGYGTTDDQPLALVRVLAGSTIIQEVVDLRCWSGPGGAIALDLLARDYNAIPGAVLNIDGIDWAYLPGTNGVYSWQNRAGLPVATTTTPGGMSAADKKKLDAATAVDTPSALMMRDSAGRARVKAPVGVADIANKQYVDMVGTKSQKYGFVQPSGWQLDGICWLAFLSDGRVQATVDVNLIRTGAAYSLGTSFTGLGNVLPSAARTDPGRTTGKYLPMFVSGGDGGNNKVAGYFVNTQTGEIKIRSNDGTWSWQTGAMASLNFTYYIYS